MRTFLLCCSALLIAYPAVAGEEFVGQKIGQKAVSMVTH
jgi:hypothetical protein